MGTRVHFPAGGGGAGGVCVRGLRLATQFHLVPNSSMRGAIPLRPLCFFAVWTGTAMQHSSFRERESAFSFIHSFIHSFIYSSIHSFFEALIMTCIIDVWAANNTLNLRELCVLLGCYAAYGGNSLPTIRDTLSLTSAHFTYLAAEARNRPI